jgi:hypothetical protein
VAGGMRQCLAERRQGHVPALSECEPAKPFVTLA